MDEIIWIADPEPTLSSGDYALIVCVETLGSLWVLATTVTNRIERLLVQVRQPNGIELPWRNASTLGADADFLVAKCAAPLLDTPWLSVELRVDDHIRLSTIVRPRPLA